MCKSCWRSASCIEIIHMKSPPKSPSVLCADIILSPPRVFVQISFRLISFWSISSLMIITFSGQFPAGDQGGLSWNISQSDISYVTHLKSCVYILHWLTNKENRWSLIDVRQIGWAWNSIFTTNWYSKFKSSICIFLHCNQYFQLENTWGELFLRNSNS